MNSCWFKNIYDEDLAVDAIINDRIDGHKNDYLLLHVLLKKYKPRTFFEIGTNSGYGTLIIKNALGDDGKVMSLDLAPHDAYKSKQHPINEGKKGVGFECSLPYVQLFGDSRRFDYDRFPCEGYFIDSEHTFENVFIESIFAYAQNPKIIIWHDSEDDEVWQAIKKASENKPYELTRVVDTRISFAIKKGI